MTPRLHPDVLATTTDTGMVLLDQHAGRYYELNPTGAAVVESLLAGTDPVRDLVRRTSVPEQQAARDVDAFLRVLRDHGLAVTR